MTTGEKTTLTKPSGRELVFTRTFDAPRELVFEAWTEPAHLEKWWGPIGFRTETLETNVRRGGMWRYVMHAPNGHEFRNRVAYSDVTVPERLVYSIAGQDGEEPAKVEVTTTFEELGGRTLVTMRMVFVSESVMDELVRTFKVDKGAMETLERLGEHLAQMPNLHGELVLTRTFDAAPEDVYRAWTDADILKLWWGPRGFTNPVCEVDAQVGGALKIVMRGPDGTEYPMRGIFREVIAPERLVFSNVPVDDQDRALMLGVTTVTFEPLREGTKMTMKTVAIGVHPMAARMLKGMEAGWGQSLDRLVDLVMASARAS